jgi:hypothetical protein
MKNTLLTILCCSSGLVFAHGVNVPCASITNAGGSVLTVENDPNWDDQQVIVNGKKRHSFKILLNNNQSVDICGTWSQFGLNFYDAKGKFAAATVSNLDSNVTSLIEIYPDNGINYTTNKQTADYLAVSIINLK